MKRDDEKLALFYGGFQERAILNPINWINHIEKMYGKERPKVPKYCILSFFREMYDYVKDNYNPCIIDYPPEDHPIYIFKHKNLEVSYLYPGVGAPYVGAMLEQMIALGADYSIFLSGVGTLVKEIQRGEVILPTRALRDEGTSFHYQKPSRYSYPSELILKYTRKSLKEKRIPFHEGATWTTDAFFRETHQRVKKFRGEGCLCVEMEASALFSIAKFRKKHIGGIFIAGDCVAGETWDPRRKAGDEETVEKDRRKLLDYALDALYLLHREIKR